MRHPAQKLCRVLFFVQLPGGETMDIGTAVLAALPALLITLPEVTAEQDSALAVALVTMVVVPLIALVGRLIGRFDKVVTAINRLENALDRSTERSDATLAAAQRNGSKLDMVIQRMDALERLHILRDHEAH